MVPNYAMVLRTIMTLKCPVSIFGLFSELNEASCNPFDASTAQAPLTVLLVINLKTSSMDSVTTYI